jgi:hypothetical protein
MVRSAHRPAGAAANLRKRRHIGPQPIQWRVSRRSG